MPHSSALPGNFHLADRPTVFRIDRFTCPRIHWPAFSEKLAFIDEELQQHPDCLLTRVAMTERDDLVYVVTLAEWISRDTLLSAKRDMAASYSDKGFDPQAFMAERGITGEFATFDTIGF